MSNWKNEYWKKVITTIREEYPHVNTTYSSADGWANVAYKNIRHHITYKMSWNYISSILYLMEK